MFRFLMIALSFFLCACAAAPVVQVAGYGMTGYDAAMLADDYLPRERVEFNKPMACSDAVIERRMDERLLIKGYPELSPYSFGGHVYLVGEVLDRPNGQRATEIARSVLGIKSLTTHFFPVSDLSDVSTDRQLTTTLSQRFKKDTTLGTSPLRIAVVQRTAVVMGPAATPELKRHALNTARTTPGIQRVVDYVVVAR
ncbi:BON domain-containing protein [Salidesulfovibrio onnuriiensis]|uniref:BON domain-containing protein n=1 Tax=Salidesulfovibrio onnuriiensis TaxID=2583823 RepID=UPI001650A5B9|nr:BON domain-containing protein [Salidesulfovibrio onnuriiensis]